MNGEGIVVSRYMKARVEETGKELVVLSVIGSKKRPKKGINKFQKGKRAEFRCRNSLRDMGYSAELSSASKGPFDVYAHNDKEWVVCQVKAGGKPPKAEMDNLRRIVVPPNTRKLVYIYKDGFPNDPIIEEVK